MKNYLSILWLWTVAYPFVWNNNLKGAFLSGEGHYGSQLEIQTSPQSQRMPKYHALEHDFRWMGEIRVNDLGSFFGEMRLFESPYFWGTGMNHEGEILNQPLSPHFSKAFVRYGWTPVLLEVGRRPRHWGMGVFTNHGTEPFQRQASVYDGVSFNWNAQKYQNLTFVMGYDKLPEVALSHKDQYFLQMVYDDRQEGLGKIIGLYAKNLKSLNPSISKTDESHVNMHLGFFFVPWSFESESFLRFGHSSDARGVFLGGSKDGMDGDLPFNDIRAMAFHGKGKVLLPQDPSQEFSLSLTWLPGESQGYYDETIGLGELRKERTYAVEAHENFHPTLILFQSPQNYHLHLDGIYNPRRAMNANILGFGYKWDRGGLGILETQIFYAKLNTSVPEEVKNFYDNSSLNERPIGFFSSSLGWEFDATYGWNFAPHMGFNLAMGWLLPGQALKTDKDLEPISNYLLKAQWVFSF